MNDTERPTQTDEAIAAHEDGRHGVGSFKDLQYWKKTCPICHDAWVLRWEV